MILSPFFQVPVVSISALKKLAGFADMRLTSIR